MTYVRTASQADLDAIIDMGQELQNESKEYEQFLSFDRQNSHAHYAKELENKTAVINVAIDDTGAITGYQYSYLIVLDYLTENNRECVLEALYVKPSYRGGGIAKVLIEAAQNWAVEVKADRMKAGIYAGNLGSEQAHLKAGFAPYYTEYVKTIPITS